MPGPSNVDPYGWDDRVEHWKEVESTGAFQAIRDRVCELARPRTTDRVVDLGSGLGLLALAIAPRVARVVAVDISPRMLEELRRRAAADGADNVVTMVADLRKLPLKDASVDLVVSSYAFHHLDDAGKELALAEARRVLVPGGRVVVADMMFSLSLNERDRWVIWEKFVAIARRGPAGILRLLRNAGRIAAGRWEQPAPPETWQRMLDDRGFEDVTVTLLEHEAGVATARRPAASGTEAPARAARASSSGR